MGKHPTDRSQRMLLDERHEQGHYNGKKKFRPTKEHVKDEESWAELQTYLGKNRTASAGSFVDDESPPL